MAPRKLRRPAAAAAPPPESPPAEDVDSELSEAEASPEPPTGSKNAGPATTLKFKDTLLGRPGRPIQVSVLLKRLQALAEELKSLEQAESDDFKEACKPVAKELSDNSILGHKDKGVRAFAAQCIVDLLALCAPDAPFSTQGLKASFEMIIKSIFPALADPSHAYNAQHVYVLTSLAEVKSILLITDLPTSNKLMIQLFTTFFDIYAGTAKTAGSDEPLSKHVEYNMLNIMVTLVDEAESLPQEVVDIIVAQFLRVDPKIFGIKDEKPKKKGDKADDKQQTLIRKELPTAYVAAKNICTMVSEKMAQEISKYFSDVIMEASGANADGSRRKSSGDVEDLDDSTMGPSEEDMADLQKAHRLVRELWRACPAVLTSVVPQLEAELSVENVQLRVLATETLGDMISGIGAGGPPPLPQLDPAAYPPISLLKAAEPTTFDPLTTPASPTSFPQTHQQAYSTFLGRRQDKSFLVRAAWTTSIGRIISTSAGGVGLNHAEEARLVEDLGRMLNDSDEKVRLAAIKAIGAFNCHDVVNKLGSAGGMSQEGSALHNLATRVKDKRHLVRVEAAQTLARFWAAAHSEIADGNQQVFEAIGKAPSFILDAFYINSPDITQMVEQVIHEILLPIGYPPVKNKGKEKRKSSSQRDKDTQDDEMAVSDPDAVRAKRMLVLVSGLDEKPKRVFVALSSRQATFSKYVLGYLSACEDYNGGVMDKEETVKTERVTQLVEAISKLFDERPRVHADLWKFAKAHDRRNYQLIRFCIDPKSDYRTVVKAMKELKKRLSESNSNLMETLTPVLYRASLILYNRSHVPAILQFSKPNHTDKDLVKAAHLLLKDISDQSPAVLETHIQDMWQSLVDDPPSPTRPNDPTALDNLKACAAFARGYPHKLPKDNNSIEAMKSYTLHGSPPDAGKHAVSVILAASGKDKSVSKDILKKCLKGLKYGQDGFLTRLASISQVMLLAPEQASDYQDQVFQFVMEEILTKVRTKNAERGYVWEVDVDEECSAKLWAIKIVVNRIRSYPDADTLHEVADPIFATLSYIVANEGDLSPTKETPAPHKPQLRLLAAHSLLKLCRSQRHDNLLDPLAFVKLAEVAQDPIFDVRNEFLRRLKKYIQRHSMPARFYAIPFLLAYEPTPNLKNDTMTWLRSRAQLMASQTSSTTSDSNSSKKRAHTTMEATMARLISLLAHHTDYDSTAAGLLELAQYILYYLTSIATSDNISLIYHIAQRVKAHRDDVVGSSKSTFADKIRSTVAKVDYDVRLHTLSDLACATIRALVDAHDWNLQTLPGRAKLPQSLFKEITDHDVAIEIAEKDFLPDGLSDKLETFVRELMRKRAKPDNRKRKSEAVVLDDDDDRAAAKRAKRASNASAIKSERTPKSAKRARSGKRRADDSESGSEVEFRGARVSDAEKTRRKSGRGSNARYLERDDDQDDEEMLNGVAEWEYENGKRQKDNADDSDEDEEDEDEDEDEDEEGEAEEEDEPEPEPSKPTPRAKTKVKAKTRSTRQKPADEDVEMTDDVEPEVEDEPTSSPPTPVSSPPVASKRGKAKVTPKGKEKASAAPPSSSKAKSATRASARGADKENKKSPAAEKKSATTALPTRSGRATRATAK